MVSSMDALCFKFLFPGIKKMKPIDKYSNTLKEKFPGRLFFNSIIASFDQGLLSILHFFITFILIKTVSKADYGYFSIAWAVSFFLVSLQNAVVTTPLSVLYISKTQNDRWNYAKALWQGQYLLLTPIILFGLLIVFFFYLHGYNQTKVSIAGAVCITSIGIFSREFLRSYYFVIENAGKVLTLDLVYIACNLFLVFSLYFFFHPTVPVILIVIGFSSVIATLVSDLKLSRTTSFISGIIDRFKSGQPEADFELIRTSYKENWIFGKWSLLGVIISHLQNHCYLYLLGAMIGSSAVAEVSASRLLLAPFVLFEAGWGKVTIPYGAKMRENNKINHYINSLAISIILFGMIIVGYVTGILVLSNHLGFLAFFKKYSGTMDYVILWGVVYFLRWLKMSASYGLQVIKKFKPLAALNVFTMLITLVSAIVLIETHGITGALYALGIGEAIFAILLWSLLLHSVFVSSELTPAVNTEY